MIGERESRSPRLRKPASGKRCLEARLLAESAIRLAARFGKHLVSISLQMGGLRCQMRSL